jgi:PPE family
MGGNDSGYPQECRNWMGISHQKLYDDIHTGPGVAGTMGTLDTYQRIAALFAKVDEDIQTGLAKLGIAYQGQGSDAAQSGISVLQQWTRDAQVGSQLASNVVDYQAAGYTSARDSMPEPVQVTAQDGFFDKVYDFFGGTTPREAQEEQARAAHLQAAQVMSVYDAQSASAANAMPTFVPPPSVTVEVAEPATTQTSIDQMNETAGPPGGGPPTTGGGGGAGPTQTVQQVPSIPGGSGGGISGPSGAGGSGGGSGAPAVPTVPGPGGVVPTAPAASWIPTPGGSVPVTYPGTPGAPGSSGAGGLFLPPTTGTGPGGGFGVERPSTGSGGAVPRSGSGTGSVLPRAPGTGYPRMPGAGSGISGYPTGRGGASASGGADYEHTRRPGLRAGGFGPRGFEAEGPGGRAGAGRGLGAGAPGGGLDPEGFGPRGKSSSGGGPGLGRGGSFGAGALPEEGVHGGRGGGTNSAGARGAAGGAGYMQPAAPGAGREDDAEHRRKYVVESDEYFADDRLVPPPVIGENPQR